MKDIFAEITKDKTLKTLVKDRFNEVKELFNLTNIKFNSEKKAKTKGGRLPINLNPLDIIPQGLKAVKDKVVDIAEKVIKGRDGYSPSVTAIIEKFADQEVKSIELHRKVLSTVYTGLLNVLTLGEFNKRLKDQPKDKLFHISMWVKLANGKTVLVEKNEVINMKVNPKKEKEEEVQPAGAVPTGLKFGEMLDKTQNQMGGKYFTYSARDNNCGNYIEGVLKANGMNTADTHAFIGQDAKAILKGYPRISKVMNTITDIAGRANVVVEGGGMCECDCGSDSECECDDKEMNGEGFGPSRDQLAALSPEELNIYHTFYVEKSATVANRFLRLTPEDRAIVLNFMYGRQENIREQARVMSIVFNKNITPQMIVRQTTIPTPAVTPPESDNEENNEISGDGLMGRGFHVATMSNKFHRIPQSESQIQSYLQGSGMKGEGTTFGRQRVAPDIEAQQLRMLQLNQQRRVAPFIELQRVQRERDVEARRIRQEEERIRQEEAIRREMYIKNIERDLLKKEDIEHLIAMSRRSATTRQDQLDYVLNKITPKILKDKSLTIEEQNRIENAGYKLIDALTEREIILPIPVEVAIPIPYYSINDIREASVVPSEIARAVPLKPTTKTSKKIVPIAVSTVVPDTRYITIQTDSPYISGFGLKKPKFAKGSQEAKDYMKMLRDKKEKEIETIIKF